MKFSLDRVKSIDWKKFFVSHGEKVALGVVGLIVVFVLYKTKYATFTDKKPADFVLQVSNSDETLTAANWPVSEQRVYDKNYDVEALYKNNYREVKPDKFLYDGFPIVWAVHRRQEDIQEPTWFAVEDLEAYAGRMVLELPNAGGGEMSPEGVLVANDPTNPNDAQMSDAERRLRENRQAKKSQQGGEFGPGAGRGGPMGLNNPGAPMGDDANLAGPMGMGEGTGEGTGETGVVLNIRGMRYVAVRGVLPFAKQYRAVQKAQHDTHRKDPNEVVGIKDFEIQRKTAQPGSNPWGDPDKGWKTLDVSLSRDVIKSAANFDEEIADWTQTSNVITSPLPSRLLWVWNSDWVGHPKIKSLSEKEQELRRTLNEQLVAMQKDQSATDAEGRGGFATMTQDVRNLQEGVANDAGQRIKFRKNLAQQFNMGGGEEGGQLPPGIDGILDQTNEIPEYMLFRYFDFDVEPGQAYRYRVRVVINNPNYDKLPETLAAPDVGEGKTRETPWSGASPVAVLPDDSKFYVSDVIPGTRSREPKAKINLYQWLKQVGTTANQIVEVQIGQIIGQPEAVKKTVKNREEWDNDSLLVEVLRPYQSFKKEAMELITKSAVVDLVDSPGKQGRDFHPDLKLSALQPTWQGEVRPLNQVLIVNEFGELENRNPIAQRQEQFLTKLALTIEQEDFLDLKKLGTLESGGEGDPMSEGGSVDDLIDAGGGEGPMGDGPQRGRGRKRPSRPGANPTRLGRGRTGA